jgi:acid phosphatase
VAVVVAALTAAAVLAAACSQASPSRSSPSPPASPHAPPPATTPSPAAPSSAVPSSSPVSTGPDHVLIVVFENKAIGQLDRSAQAPYLNGLMARSAVYTNLHAETHPSQPNYIALFTGDTHGVTSDACPVRLHNTPNLGRQLLDAGRTFVGYSEGLPAVGYTGCAAGRYAAKHNPWVDVDNLPATVNQPATAMPSDYAALPTVSFLIPDLCNDMHDCPVSTGDTWARTHLDPYVRWAQTHNSALIVTFDEDDNSATNRILTLVSGARTTPGRYGDPANHYSLLATVESWYGLRRLGHAATTAPLPHAWD